MSAAIGIERADIKQHLLRNTENALARGVFGVPTFFVDGELFFGQDRLEFVVEALRASATCRETARDIAEAGSLGVTAAGSTKPAV